jgi:hypothetical protein
MNKIIKIKDNGNCQTGEPLPHRENYRDFILVKDIRKIGGIEYYKPNNKPEYYFFGIKYSCGTNICSFSTRDEAEKEFTRIIAAWREYHESN